ncbi:MAG TPA: VanZ family protein [Candidatus Faecousia intestinigallinarum]|nr:VanZ family protein [Candidatus Faecousia intestinigallinarum]
MDDQDVRKRRLYRLLFGVYCLGMALLLFHRPVYSLEEREYWQILTENQNLIPFRTIRVCLELLHAEEAWLRRYATVNFYGNILLFLPWGMLLPRVWRTMESHWRFLLFSAGVILAVEAAQLFSLRGSCDIDDVILNLSGMLLGFWLGKLWRRWRRSPAS